MIDLLRKWSFPLHEKRELPIMGLKANPIEPADHEQGFIRKENCSVEFKPFSNRKDPIGRFVVLLDHSSRPFSVYRFSRHR